MSHILSLYTCSISSKCMGEWKITIKSFVQHMSQSLVSCRSVLIYCWILETGSRGFRLFCRFQVQFPSMTLWYLMSSMLSVPWSQRPKVFGSLHVLTVLPQFPPTPLIIAQKHADCHLANNDIKEDVLPGRLPAAHRSWPGEDNFHIVLCTYDKNKYRVHLSIHDMNIKWWSLSEKQEWAPRPLCSLCKWPAVRNMNKKMIWSECQNANTDTQSP